LNAATARPFVVVPCLNEAASIRGLLGEILAQCRDVIVVDDGSTDATAALVAELPVTLIRHPTRRGKGEALRSGFRAALAAGATGVLTMDGDGQHAAADIPRLLAAAAHCEGSLVIGARLLDRDRQPAGRRRANDFADWGISWGCGQPVADTQSGQRWYPRAAVELASVTAQDFVFEAALLIAAARDLHLSIVSVPIASRYQGGTRHSHFRPVRDVLQITWYTIRRVVHYGHVVQSYRASHGARPRIYDPAGLLGAGAVRTCCAGEPAPARRD
jgi:glycosyltransferase involved in cell wall biosynthesis